VPAVAAQLAGAARAESRDDVTTIGIYCSARGESGDLADWLAAADDADVIAVNVTGPGDTFPVLDINPKVVATQLKIEPWSSSDAFNTAMGRLPQDLDVAIRLDTDEYLRPGWRDAVEALDWSKPMSARPWYEHPGGVTWRHDRIHSRHGFHWAYPVHEELVGEGERVSIEATIEHRQDPNVDRTGVIEEIRVAFEADPDNRRWPYYYGRELAAFGRYKEAIDVLYPATKVETFAEEQSEIWRLLGDCLVGVQPIEFVSDIPYRKAAQTCPWRREGWVSLAILYREQQRWAECLAATETALSISERSWYPNHPYAWDDDALTQQAAMLCRAVLPLEPDAHNVEVAERIAELVSGD